VVVVGAGVAGLSVTAALVAAGLDVRCLEATGRVGGRLLSLDVAGGSLDLGATWFWAGERRVARLVEHLGVTTFPQHIAGDAMYEDGRGIRRLDGNPIDVPAYRYLAGAQSLADGLAGGLPPGAVTLSSPVTSISADGDRLQVDCDGVAALCAEHVVLAVAPALAVARIRFTPALPERVGMLAAATPVWMGAISKVVIQYPEAFWRTDGLAGAAISARGPLREIHDMSGPAGHPAALFGFAPNAVGEPAMAAEQVVAQLVRLFGPRAAHPERVVPCDWAAAAYTSPADVGSRTSYELFGHRLFTEPAFAGRLHWAGTETSQVNPGHVEGALAAGERAAAAVIAALSGRGVS